VQIVRDTSSQDHHPFLDRPTYVFFALLVHAQKHVGGYRYRHLTEKSNMIEEFTKAWFANLHTTRDRPAAARAQALEEAARVCDAEITEFSEQAARNDGRNSDMAFGSISSAERITTCIRALKTTP
jgi:hypothetical protein